MHLVNGLPLPGMVGSWEVLGTSLEHLGACQAVDYLPACNHTAACRLPWPVSSSLQRDDILFPQRIEQVKIKIPAPASLCLCTASQPESPQPPSLPRR